MANLICANRPDRIRDDPYTRRSGRRLLPHENKRSKTKESITALDIADKSTADNAQSLKESGTPAKDTPPQQAPALQTVPQRPSSFFALMRVLLIILSLIVAAGFLLILLSQKTTDRFVEDLRSRSSSSDQEMISFLYLGHEIQNDEFHIRGVVRNITTEPIEHLDAAVRLYSHDRELIETAVVRMNKEIIDPDEIAQFELVYPNYQSEFASYSVEFKLRRGAFVPYKDMRGLQEQSDSDSGEGSE